MPQSLRTLVVVVKHDDFVGKGEQPAAPALEPSQVRPFQAIPVQTSFFFLDFLKKEIPSPDDRAR